MTKKKKPSQGLKQAPKDNKADVANDDIIVIIVDPDGPVPRKIIFV